MLARGDLDRLFALYWEPVLGWIYATARVHPGEAEEIRQQVFLRITRELGRGKKYRLPFGAAIFNIAGWTTRGYVEGQAKLGEREAAMGDDDHQDLVDDRPRREIDEIGQDDDIAQLFARLPQREAQLMTMHYLEGMPLSEVAEVMEIAANNAHQIHHRAKQHLLQLIAEDGA